MATAPLSDPIIAAVADLFHQDRWQPSHDDLTIQFRRVGLSHADPRSSVAMIGKRKRVRGVLLHALDENLETGQQLVANLIGLVKGAGGFRKSSDYYVGDEAFENLRATFHTEGVLLDDDGNLRPIVLDGLEGAGLDQALLAYVRRAQRGADDAALLTGTSKDLLEASARRTILRAGSTYQGQDFPGTLFTAFYAAGLAAPTQDLIDAMNNVFDHDPRKRFIQSLYVAGCAVNRLRNDQGTGHGRPFPATVTDAEARAAIQLMGLISQLLLDPVDTGS